MKNMLSIEIRKDKIKTISCVLFVMIWFKELVGKKPPEEMTVIARLSPSKSLIPEIENSIKTINVKFVERKIQNVSDSLINNTIQLSDHYAIEGLFKW